MNKKGFTLVELLAVIAILLLLISLITPKIIGQIENSKDVAYNEQIEELINASRIYVNQNSNLLQEDINVITLQELKNSGLLNSSKVLNPITKEELTGCIIVRYTNNKYEYKYSEEENECNPTLLTFDPQGGIVSKNSKKVIKGEPYGELPTPTRNGYTFMGWSTSPTDQTILYDENEYYGSATSGNIDLKEYVIPAPFEEGEVYQLDVDVKGEGELTNYFYGNTNFLSIKKIVTSQKETYVNGDGKNYIALTNEYKHYTAKFTLGKSGDGSVDKSLLFRLFSGNTAYIKNIKFTKVSGSSIIYTEKEIKNNQIFNNSYLIKILREYHDSLASDSSAPYKDMLEFFVYSPFSENEIYQLDVDVKGTGRIIDYFHGNSGYLKVKKSETSQGKIYTNGDGANDIFLTNEYRHFTVKFTLGSTGDGSVVKRLLFRLFPGNEAFIKNIEFKKIYTVEEEVLPQQVDMYAVWYPNQ